MSTIERDGQVYKKPQNPLDPENSNWDMPIEKRLTELESRMTNIEINLVDLLRTIIDKTTPKEGLTAAAAASEDENDISKI